MTGYAHLLTAERGRWVDASTMETSEVLCSTITQHNPTQRVCASCQRTYAAGSRAHPDLCRSCQTRRPRN